MSTGITISLIAALDRAYAIGRDGQLPWHLPEDLKHFKALTLGHPVLMGRKTAKSISRALPGRVNLVLSRSHAQLPDGMQRVAHFDEALDAARQQDASELCVIGGGEIYAIALQRAHRMHLTWVDTEIAGADAWFPEFNAAQWRESARRHVPADPSHAHCFDFVDYVKPDSRLTSRGPASE